MTMYLPLPAYTGPDGPCPSCGLPGALTEWHQPGPLTPSETASRRLPCADPGDLDLSNGGGEHLCRFCLNCGHGWPEACISRAAAPAPVPLSLSPAQSGVVALGAGLGATAAAALLGRVLGGTVFAVTLLAVIAAIAVLAAAVRAALADRSAHPVAGEQAAR